MLNVPAIKTAMAKRGLTGTALAEACGVSKEAASNWLAGESLPRPGKLARIAEVLELTVDDILEVETVPEPIFAYRTQRNRAVSGDAKEAALEMTRHLQELLPFIEGRSDFEPPQMRDPSLDETRIRAVANSVRASIGLRVADELTNQHLVDMFHAFGAVLVPVLWGREKVQHENALSVYLPGSKASFVVFNLGCKQDDYKYWLAHEYGHCLSLHQLQGDDGEAFAERFAQHLLFPEEAARDCLAEMRTAPNWRDVAERYATRHGISIITVVKGVDRLEERLPGHPQGLATNAFYMRWNAARGAIPSVAQLIFGTDTPSPEQYVSMCESTFRTPVFKALRKLQGEYGGRNPAFIAKALNVGLGEAVVLSRVLSEPQRV